MTNKDIRQNLISNTHKRIKDMGIKNAKVDEQVIREARKQIGGLFKRRRIEMGYSQSEVAEFCGITYRTVANIESGKFAYSVDLMFLMSVFLKVNITFEEKEEMREKERFILQKEKQGRYILTDTKNEITCEFLNKHFNETQHFTMLKEEIIPVNKLATIMREMEDWLYKNYRELL